MTSEKKSQKYIIY